ncbi:hypothetical protein [Chamaesiphon polymorphus]|uniref:Antibiotic biosynthesis monooxygenase n=1 Tax=Chamaesiphon polymorphus CCALA 037 TaxID=2107692 RepID=A0A2T1GGF2_9CYAN|nr:hypothetical protein [Chamaesiphon polymorphus]PSB56719.1 hypothetical protein C7B77_10945 [Chamaesiphon polymorphus CCALA 037]
MNSTSEARIHQVFYSSLVTEYITPQGKDFAFKRWHHRLVNRAKNHPGFMRFDLCPPLRCIDPVVKWYSIVHFDSPEHLDSWVGSIDRQQLVVSGRQIFHAYRFKSFTTGLEGWFSHQQGGAERPSLSSPAWKKILTVVVGLYPTLMIQSQLFSALGIFNSWSPASRMLINNLITSSILTLIVMPFISQKLHFWLQPTDLLASRKNDLTGAFIVITILGVMMVLFDRF